MRTVSKALRIFNKAVAELEVVEKENMALATKRFDQADLLIAEGKDLAAEAATAGSIKSKLESLITQ